MKSIIYVCVIAMSVFLTGCVATGAKCDNMVVSYQDKYPEHCQDSKFYKKLTLGEVKGGQETNPLLLSKISNEDLKEALKMSLAKFHYVYADSKPQYRVDVELMDLKQPIFGFNTTVQTVIKYKITEIDGDKPVLEQTVDAAYTAKVSEAYIGVKRLRIANEGSVKNNITQFIDGLGAVRG